MKEILDSSDESTQEQSVQNSAKNDAYAVSNNIDHNGINTVSQPSHTRFFSFISYVSIRAAALLLIVGVGAIAGYFIVFFPTKTVGTPRLVGESLIDAVLLLQERNLYPYITLQYTSDPLDRGKVISQSPDAGMVLREKREVNLVVSRGVIIAEIPDYMGRSLVDIQDDIVNQFAGFDKLLRIGSVDKVFDISPAETIIGQTPLPGTKVSNINTTLRFVVSRGDKESDTVMVDVTGLNYTVMFPILEKYSLKFEFYISENTDATISEMEMSVLHAGVIIEQTPAPGGTIMSDDTLVRIGVRGASRTADADETNATDSSASVDKEYPLVILEIHLPRYRTPHSVTLYESFLGKTEDRTKLFTVNTMGGTISIPYHRIPGIRYEAVVNNIVIWQYAVPPSEEE